MMTSKAKKRRNDQLRKRKKRLFSKAYQYGLLGIDVAVIVYNPEDKRYYTYRSTDRESWPPPMKDIVSLPLILSNRDTQLAQQLAFPLPVNLLPSDFEEPSEKMRPETNPGSKDTNLNRQSQRIEAVGDNSILPEPPSFDLNSLSRWHVKREQFHNGDCRY
jgi:hypothetical protein